MPNDISDTFHMFLRTVKSDLDDVWTKLKAAFHGVVEDTLTSLEADIKAAGPEVFQIVSTAALAALSGGSGAIGPALTAALAAIEKEGLVVAEQVVHGIVASVISNLKTPNVVVAPTTPAASGA